MKKSLIALAVAGAMTVPMVAQADATVSGEWVGVIADEDGGDLSIYHDTLELGVDGTVANDIDGLETGFEIRFESEDGTANVANDLRLAYGYMAGGFGTVTVGKSSNVADIITDTGLNGGAFTPNSGRLDRYLSYVTPDMGGFTAAAGFTADGDETTDSLAQKTLMAGFAIAGVDVAISYDEIEDSAEILALNAAYSMDNFTVFGSYWDDDEAETDGFSLGGEFGIGASTLYAEYDSTEVSDEDQTLILVGVSYALGSDAWVGVEYNEYNSDAEDAGNNDVLAAYYGLSF